jgi:hypothetical protein
LATNGVSEQPKQRRHDDRQAKERPAKAAQRAARGAIVGDVVADLVHLVPPKEGRQKDEEQQERDGRDQDEGAAALRHLADVRLDGLRRGRRLRRWGRGIILVSHRKITPFDWSGGRPVASSAGLCFVRATL